MKGTTKKENRVRTKAVSTGKNFLYPIPLFCTKLDTIGILYAIFTLQKICSAYFKSFIPSVFV